MNRAQTRISLSNNTSVKSIRLGNGSKHTVGAASKDIANKIHSLASNSSRDAYLKKELGLNANERKKIFTAITPKTEKEIMRDLGGFKTESGRKDYLLKNGIKYEKKDDYLKRFRKREISNYLKAKDDSYMDDKGGKTSSLGISDNGGGFSGNTKQENGFAGGSGSSSSPTSPSNSGGLGGGLGRQSSGGGGLGGSFSSGGGGGLLNI